VAKQSDTITDSQILRALKAPTSMNALCAVLGEGVTSAKMRPRLKALIDAGKVKREGQTRATTYQAM
jgi:predicted HTH transcriptional regulator